MMAAALPPAPPAAVVVAKNPIPPVIAAPVLVDALHPVHGIQYDIFCPAAGGVGANIPPGHFHAGHSKKYYYDHLIAVLRQFGYDDREYSCFSRATDEATALMEARTLQQHPSLTWMAVPGVMRAMHVVRYCHHGSLYP
jgi:hypothetical protein